MVQAVAGLLLPASLGSTISVFGVTLATASGLTFAGSLVNLALGVAVSRALAPSPTLPSPQDVQQNFRSAVGPRIVHVGRVKVGGQLVSVREGEGNLYQLLAQGHRAIDGFEAYFIDGNEVTLDGNGFVEDSLYSSGGVKRVQILTRLGEIPSTYYPEITTQFVDWTPEHRLDGIPSALIVANAPAAAQFSSMFPNRAPSFQSVIRGIPLFDPRTGASQWSENNALAIRDYIANEDGLGSQDIDDVSFAAAANDCDDVLATSLGTDARYRIGGSYRLTDSAGTVLNSMLRSCDGRIYMNNQGQFALRVGKSISPSVTLDEKHLIAILRWDNGPSKLNAFTSVKPEYTDQELGYVSQTTDPWQDADLVNRYGSESFDESYALELVPTHHQARRLSKIHVNKQNPIYTARLRYNLHGLKALGEDFVNISISLPEFGLEYTGPVEVESVSISGAEYDGTASVSYVDIDVRVISPDTYSWTISEEGEKPVNPISDDVGGIPDVTNLVAIGHGSGGAGIAVAWDVPSSSLIPLLEYSVSGADTWTEVSLAEGTERHVIGGLVDAQLYDVRLAWKTPNDTVGEYTTTSATAATSTASPSAPTLFTVSDLGLGQAQIQITASASGNNYRTIVLRDGVIVAQVVGAASAALQFIDSAGPGEYVYTAQAESVAGDLSASIDTTPTTTTIT